MDLIEEYRAASSGIIHEDNEPEKVFKKGTKYLVLIRNSHLITASRRNEYLVIVYDSASGTMPYRQGPFGKRTALDLYKSIARKAI